MNDTEAFPERFTAVVLAADREPANPVARAAGVGCKAMAPVGGIPMAFRVLDALSSSAQVKDLILCGPPESVMAREPALKARIAEGGVKWIENLATPSESAYHVMQSLPPNIPVLLTTADHALLRPGVVDYFCAEALASGCDVVAAIARRDIVAAAYPKTRRTAYRLRESAYCSCNLFAFVTPRARAAADFWRRVEQQRKSPLRVINAFGWTAVMRYLMGRLTVAGALKTISRRLGFAAGIVDMPFPEAAIDVDSVQDWYDVEEIAADV